MLEAGWVVTAVLVLTVKVAAAELVLPLILEITALYWYPFNAVVEPVSVKVAVV